MEYIPIGDLGDRHQHYISIHFLNKVKLSLDYYYYKITISWVNKYKLVSINLLIKKNKRYLIFFLRKSKSIKRCYYLE